MEKYRVGARDARNLEHIYTERQTLDHLSPEAEQAGAVQRFCVVLRQLFSSSSRLHYPHVGSFPPFTLLLLPLIANHRYWSASLTKP